MDVRAHIRAHPNKRARLRARRRGAGPPPSPTLTPPPTPSLLLAPTPRSCVYACYIDAARRPCEGRQLSLERLGACTDPTLQEIAYATNQLGYPIAVFENNKRHPRDPWRVGRMRVKLLKPDGSPVVPGIATKRQLLGRIADIVPTLAIRADRLEQIRKAREQHAIQMEKAAKSQKGRIAKLTAESAAQTGGAAAKKRAGK